MGTTVTYSRASFALNQPENLQEDRINDLSIDEATRKEERMTAMSSPVPSKRISRLVLEKTFY